MQRLFLFSLSFILYATAPAVAQAPFLPIEGADWGPLREHCRGLLKELPPDTARALQSLLEKPPHDPVTAVVKLLDPHCLLGVSINAESRVKAERGPAAATLIEGRPAVVLVKVHNEAGVTHALTVRQPGEGRWLKADVPGGRLSGRQLEYRLLRLTAHESGKREATFRFDVGQGTQDLGFRGEVPVLFTVRRKE